MSDRACTLCGCPVQRTLTGSLDDGMRAHLRIVHPELAQHPSLRSNDT